MKISDIIPEAKQLTKLGAQKHTKRTLRDLFGSPGPPHQLAKPIRPDVDYPNHDQRIEQAPNFSNMWIDEFRNIGNMKNPLGSPMESGA
jgi:hypothetical protein